METRQYSQGLQHVGEALGKKTFTLKPRFTTIHHPIREKFDLSLSAYAVIDSIHQLSHSPEYPWCIESKEGLGSFLSLSRGTAFNAIKEGLEKGLLEKNHRGDLRTTMTWIEQVVLYKSRDARGGEGYLTRVTLMV